VSAPNPPSAPSLSAPVATAVDPALSWTASTDANGLAGYDILRGGVLIGTAGAAATSYTDSTVSASTTYQYVVRARDNAGNTTDSAPASPPTPPGRRHARRSRLEPPMRPTGPMA